MAARRIRQLGDPILRIRCTPVQDPKSPAVRLLADDLRDTLRGARKKYNMGRALAAPQIGVLKRVERDRVPDDGESGDHRRRVRRLSCLGRLLLVPESAGARDPRVSSDAPLHGHERQARDDGARGTNGRTVAT